MVLALSDRWEQPPLDGTNAVIITPTTLPLGPISRGKRVSLKRGWRVIFGGTVDSDQPQIRTYFSELSDFMRTADLGGLRTSDFNLVLKCQRLDSFAKATSMPERLQGTDLLEDCATELAPSPHAYKARFKLAGMTASVASEDETEWQSPEEVQVLAVRPGLWSAVSKEGATQYRHQRHPSERYASAKGSIEREDAPSWNTSGERKVEKLSNEAYRVWGSCGTPVQFETVAQQILVLLAHKVKAWCHVAECNRDPGES